MNFWENRKFLKNQYEDAQWDNSTGILPEETNQILRDFVKNNPTMHKALLRSELLNIVVEKGRLELNKYDIFPDKLDHGVDYSHNATFGIYGQICAEDYYIGFDKIAVKERDQRRRLANAGVAVPDIDFWHTPFDFERISFVSF